MALLVEEAFSTPKNKTLKFSLSGAVTATVECLMTYCKRWFHGKCKMGNFYSPQWRCKLCQGVFKREQKKETERKEKTVQQLWRVTANYPEKVS